MLKEYLQQLVAKIISPYKNNKTADERNKVQSTL